MNTGLISMRYAKALFQLGLSQPDLQERLYHDSQIIMDSLKESIDLVAFLKNPVIKSDVKKRSVRQVFTNVLHDKTLRFLDVVIENNREALFINILMDYRELYRKEKGWRSVTVITAAPVDASFKDEIRQTIEQQLHGKVELECKVNEDIMGGLIVMVDGKQADGSITGKLRNLKKKLLIK